MKKTMVLLGVMALCGLAAGLAAADRSWAAKGATGEALFRQHCQLCHADGGNIVNPKKALHRKDREARNIKTADDIVKIMRKPGPGMPVFDETTISDADAREIGKYIIRTFNK